MKKIIFQLLAKLNKIILPSYAKRDLTRLSKFDWAIIGWRYWVTVHAIEK